MLSAAMGGRRGRHSNAIIPARGERRRPCFGAAWVYRAGADRRAVFGGVGIFWGAGVIGASILIPLAETLHAELWPYSPRHPGRESTALAVIVIILVAPGRQSTGRCADRFMARRDASAPAPCRRQPRRDRAGAECWRRSPVRAMPSVPPLLETSERRLRARFGGPQKRSTRSPSRSPKA